MTIDLLEIIFSIRIQYNIYIKNTQPNHSKIISIIDNNQNIKIFHSSSKHGTLLKFMTIINND